MNDKATLTTAFLSLISAVCGYSAPPDWPQDVRYERPTPSGELVRSARSQLWVGVANDLGPSSIMYGVVGPGSISEEMVARLREREVGEISPGKLTVLEAIPNSDVARAVVEAVLFQIYGREHVESQRPYQCERAGAYWVLTGARRKGSAMIVVVVQAATGAFHSIKETP